MRVATSDLGVHSHTGDQQTWESLQKSVRRATMVEFRAAARDMSPLQAATMMLQESHLRLHPKSGSVDVLARHVRQTGAETSFLVSVTKSWFGIPLPRGGRISLRCSSLNKKL